ncbi:MAG: flagellar hook-associated protein FlgL [Limnochordia bacterium]|jgi:flagellar hook-associated protein 3 FlgL|nr:flagellar hook-associated protein FlgL [Bacillota bacterium]HOB08997.1 flagellar hook-associated protein FlgL [Limnochordia bacterium]NLH32028.1 flagellar hook-associated protein FlgL [Bacillota bacterium]HPT92997.1 flagellar hook-associated protein FlgL [Limnochordia bacterium]HPZ31155.1 flagellar hook-associated protein FlgL [Limnochordia bacterium]
MRVTNNTLINNMLRHLNRGLSRLDRHQQQLASGKQILRPSDDPAGVISVMELRSSLAENDQLLKNVTGALSWLESVDTVLGSVTSVLHRAKELTVYAATGTLNSDDRNAILKEVEQLFANVLELSNASHGGRYLFAGQKSTTMPFQRASDDPDSPDYWVIKYHGGLANQETAALNVEINSNTVIDLNIIQASGTNAEDAEDQVFLPIFNVLSGIIQDIKNDDPGALNQRLGELEDALDGLLSVRAEVGAKLHRVALAEERLKDLHLNLNKMLSNIQDIDVAEAIVNLKNEENGYRVALAVGARIIQPTLVDFLN